MTHNEVYEQFETHFKIYIEQVKEWLPYGQNCIRIRFKDDRNYMFTCTKNELRFEKLNEGR
jgi:hypothetical protein